MLGSASGRDDKTPEGPSLMRRPPLRGPLRGVPVRLGGGAVAFVVAAIMLVACSADEGMSRAEVEETVETAVELSESGLSRGEVEEIAEAALARSRDQQPELRGAEVAEAVEAALAAMALPESGLTRGEVEEIVAAAIADMAAAQRDPVATPGESGAQDGAGTPSRGDPGAYTKFVVDRAIERYEADGLDATLRHYNSPASIDGQWYVFIIDGDDSVIGHYDPERLGLDLKGWVGTDVNGYVFGPEMLSATEDGKWVPYVYTNPASGAIGAEGEFELKNAWVVRHDGLLFGSGWYVDADEMTRSLVATAVEVFRESGLAATIAHFADPQGVTAGLQQAVDYYNRADTVEGQWLAFIADPDGTVVAHNDIAVIGSDIADLLSPAVLDASDNGEWITAAGDAESTGPQSMRVWTVNDGDAIFGAGWYRP